MLNSKIEMGKVQFDADGLVPVIIQDAQSKTVLTLAYMNETALAKTLETGETWLWSRSRQQLWHKGETSGNTQEVVSLTYDCDRDTLLAQVNPQGPACHTGRFSCFADGETDAETTDGDRWAIIQELEAVIARREAEQPEGAYTTYLFRHGVDKILKKIGEEAGEVIIAAKNRDPDELRHETADLLFHLLVLLREQKLPLDAVLQELKNRHSQS